MSGAVLDASVVLKWFRAEDERFYGAARSLRAAFRSGTLVVVAPPLLHLEIVNVAGRRWRWERVALVELARALDALSFDLRQPALASIADWTARGLTAYDASYVALAQSEAIPLVTDDERLLSAAGAIAVALGDPRPIAALTGTAFTGPDLH